MLRLLVLAALVLSGHCANENISFIEDIAKVVGGSDSSPYAWPWQVSLQCHSGSGWVHSCGGSLIRDDRVMTAAHCVDSPRTYRVALGDHNLSGNEGVGQIIPVSTIKIHANWNTNDVAAGYDIAVLHLASSATLNSVVQVATLPPEGSSLANNHPCTITGWGRTSTGGSLPSILQQAPLPVVDHATCSNGTWWGSTVKTSMVCAGGNELQAACNGDSGGPLNCPVGGVYEVHGITSFVSSGCNTLQKPTVFTKVSTYITWIKQNM